MSDDAPRTLYTNPTQDRFYFVPDDKTLPRGKLVLRSLTGKKLEVDEKTARPFEIPEGQAKEIARLQLSGYAKAAGRIVSGAGQILRQVAEVQRTQAPKVRPNPSGEELVADTLGVTTEQLHNDPDAVLAGLQNLAAGLKDMVRDAIQENPISQEETRRRMEQLAEIVGKQSPEAALTIEELPQKIRDFLVDPELEKKVNAATDRLRDDIRDMRAAREGKLGAEPEGEPEN